MSGWNIVNFTEDNTVSVVPDSCMVKKKNLCLAKRSEKLTKDN